MTAQQLTFFEEHPDIDIQQVHPELNLEKWSIWRPSKSPNKILETQICQRVVTLPDGSKQISKVEVGFSNRGMLTTEDRKTYYALIKIWEEKGRPSGEVPLSLRRLAKVLQKKWGTNVMNSLTQSLRRLQATPLEWKNSYYNATTKETEDLIASFSILSSVRTSTRKRDGHITGEYGAFEFNKYILQNLHNNYSKPLYFTIILNFKTEIAQLLYTYLDLIMADKTCYERRSAGLFEDIGLMRCDETDAADDSEGTETAKGKKAYNKPSVRKKKLESALKELHDIPLSTGMLTDVRIERTNDRKDFKVVFRKCSSDAPQDVTWTTDHTGNIEYSVEYTDSPLVSTPEGVVAYFHQQLGHTKHQTSRKERSLATTLLQTYEATCVQFIVDYTIREAKTTNFPMRWFGAVKQYVDDAVGEYCRRQQIQQQRKAQQEELPLDESVDWEHVYESLDEHTKTQIRQRAASKIASHKRNMSQQVYEETLQYAIIGEIQNLQHTSA